MRGKTLILEAQAMRAPKLEPLLQKEGRIWREEEVIRNKGKEDELTM